MAKRRAKSDRRRGSPPAGGSAPGADDDTGIRAATRAAVDGAAASDLPERLAAEARRWLVEPLAPGLHLVATPIGNLGDASPRALATLARADLVCCEDTRVTRTLLAHFGLAPPVAAYHEHNAEAERPRLMALLAGGASVALVSDAGTPLVSDPGFDLVRAAIAQGVAVHVVPGPSALLAGLAASGLAGDRFLFAGFLPAREKARRDRLAELAPVPAALVLFEAPGRLADALADIGAVLGERQVAVARELTKRFEEVRRGTASELAPWAREGVRGEIVIVVAPPAAREIADAEIAAALDAALATMSLRDAVRAVAEATGAGRTRVYELGLARKEGT